jgi:hypothetical protein
VHFLVCAAGGVEPEGGPQHAVPHQHRIPGFPEAVGTQSLPEREDDLFNVDPAVRRNQAVEQHPFLHRRKSIALHAPIPRFHFLLSPPESASIKRAVSTACW